MRLEPATAPPQPPSSSYAHAHTLRAHTDHGNNLTSQVTHLPNASNSGCKARVLNEHVLMLIATLKWVVNPYARSPARNKGNNLYKPALNLRWASAINLGPLTLALGISHP